MNNPFHPRKQVNYYVTEFGKRQKLFQEKGANYYVTEFGKRQKLTNN